MNAQLHILIVDDSEDDALQIAQRVERHGYDVQWKRVDTPEATAAALDEEPWDIILSDFSLSRCSVNETLDICKAKGLADLPLVIVSDTVGEENALRAMKNGARDCVTKEHLKRLGPVVERELRETKMRQERKLAVQALEEQTRFLLNVFASIQNGLSIIDKDFNVVRVNPMMERWYRHALPLVGRKCYEVYQQRSEPCGACPATKTFATGQVNVESLARKGEDGEANGWLEISSFPLYDTVTGEINGVIEYMQDITKRKAAEEEVMSRVAVLDAINRVFREALTCEGKKDVGKACLAVAEELTGSEYGFIGELNSDTSLDTLALSGTAWDSCRIGGMEAKTLIENMEVRGIWGKVLEGGTSVIVSDISSHPDRVGIPEGHPPITSFLGVPLKNNGVTIGMIGLANKKGGYTQTDRRDIETLSGAFVEALIRKGAEVALRESEERYRSHFENAGDIILLTDADLRVLSVSPSIETILGYSPQEIIGRTIQELDFLRQGDIEKGLTAVAQLFSGEQSVPTVFEVAAKDNSRKIMEARGSLLVKGGKTVGMTCIVRDITEQDHLQEQLRHSQKMEAIGRLAGGVAHDFNNLLTVILGHTQLLTGRTPTDSLLHQDLSEIQAAAERAADLTRQLLAFSRKQIIQPQVINLNDVLGDLRKMLRRLVREDIEIHTATAEDLSQIKADPGHVEQVIVNLAVNASDAMPEGGHLTLETANVELDETYAREHAGVTPGNYVMLAITDTGVGMNEEVREHIFEPFFTTKPTGKGTGLGLATVYGIVKRHGGNVGVYSEEGKGTTFKVYLPSVGDKERTEQTARESEMPGGIETVLVVEDDVSVRKIATRVLSELGYRVKEASSGAEALKFLEENGTHPDLLVTDVIMPGMSGKELADEYARRCPGGKVLFMSGYSDSAIHHNGTLDPGTILMQKPFTAVTLAQKVREVLDGIERPAPSKRRSDFRA